MVLGNMAGVAAFLIRYYRNKLYRQRALIQKLSENANSFRYLVETAHEGIAVVQNKRLVYLNPRMCEMSGYSEDELKALPSFMPLIAPSARDVMMENYLRRLAGKASPQRYESLFLRKNGNSYPIELSGVAIVWEGKPATLNMLTDISARKSAEQKMHYLAHHDSLTGLANRAMLQDRMKQAIALAQRTHIPLGVLFIDLNEFKKINDTYGHDVGDCLLQKVALRLNALLRESDTLARVGGDEFVALLTQVNDMNELQQCMGRIEATMKAPFYIQHHVLLCHVSQGAAVYPDDGNTAQALLHRADQNMYLDKQHYYERDAVITKAP